MASRADMAYLCITYVFAMDYPYLQGVYYMAIQADMDVLCNCYELSIFSWVCNTGVKIDLCDKQIMI